MIDFTPYINKADMQEIASRIRDIFADYEADEIPQIKDRVIEYNGWAITFSGSITNGEIDMDEITFAPFWSEQANELINL
jgi:hypothetical protein